MKLFVKRLFLIPFFVLAIASVNQSATTAHAQTGDWEYVEGLGGWLDWDTGLVWGQQKGISTWDGTVAYMSQLRDNTGLPWRMPTVAESQVASANGIVEVPGIFYRNSECWTPDAKNKGGARSAHYVFNFHWGVAYLWGNGSLIDSIPVYRAFSP